MKNKRLIILGLVVIWIIFGTATSTTYPAIEQSMTKKPNAEFDDVESQNPLLGFDKEKGALSPKYVPGEIIVKFKPEVGSVAGKLFKQGVTFSIITRTPSLDNLNTKYGVNKLERVFKTLETKARLKGKEVLTAQEEATEIKRKFPKRATRAPKNAKIPDLENIYLIKLGEGTNVLEAVEEYRKDHNLAYAEPNYINVAYADNGPFEATVESYPIEISVPVLFPNDPYYLSSGSFGQPYDDLWGLKKINSADAWNISQGQDFIVAVVDTGVDYAHEDLASNMWVNQSELLDNGIDDDGNGFVDDYYGYNFASDTSDPMDGNGHGTHVAGTIAAIGNNAKGIIGVAPLAKIMALKSLDDSGSGSSVNLADGIVYAANMGAEILNNSWGYGSPAPVSQAISDAVDYAYALGCVIVTAAGNSNDDVGTPKNGYGICTLDKVITVAASNQDDQKCSFSNYGNKIDVSAPGGGDEAILYNILSTMSEGTISKSHPELMVSNGYYRLAGTSMACPHVSGLSALILGLYPQLTGEATRYVIRNSADDVGESGFDIYFGYGRINAYNTLSISGVYINGLIIDDATGGDGNDHPDPGEKVDLIIPLISVGENATNVSATIESDNEYITIINASSNYGLIEIGQEVNNVDNPFRISINNNAPSGQILFTLNITANGGSYQRSFPFQLRVSLPQELKIVSGNYQAAYQGTVLQGPLVVKLVDQYGYPISNQNVTFEIIEGSGSLSSTEAITDFFGKSQVYMTLGNLAEGTKILKNRIIATAEGLQDHPVEFTVYTTDFKINFEKVWSLKESYPDLFKINDYYIYSIETGDLDNDGYREFYIGTFKHTSPSTKTIYVFEDSGDNLYTLIWSHDFSFAPVSLAYGDIDSDGKDELIVGESPGKIHVLDAAGNNNFSIQLIMNLYNPAGFTGLGEIKIADLDKDNIPELVIRGTYLYIFKHSGNSGEYTFTKIYEVRSSYSFGTIGDSDNDGLDEIITAAYRNPVRIIRHEYNSQTNSFENKTSHVSANIDVWPKKLLVADLDGDSLNDIFIYGQIYLDLFSWDKIIFDAKSAGNDLFAATGWQFDFDDNYFLHSGIELKKATLEGLDNPVIFVGKSNYNKEMAYCDLFSYFDNEYILINSVMLNDETVVDLVIEDLDNDNLTDLIVVDGEYGGVGGKNVVIFENKIIPMPTPVVTDEGEFTISRDKLYASWVLENNGLSIAEYKYIITQDSPAGPVIRDWTTTGINNSITADGLNLQQGKTYYFGVKAKDNMVGYWSKVGYSDGITVISCGDANSDGKVTVSDVVFLVSYLFKGGPPPADPVVRADANGDGKVSLSDIVYLINYLFKGGPEPICGGTGRVSSLSIGTASMGLSSFSILSDGTKRVYLNGNLSAPASGFSLDLAYNPSLVKLNGAFTTLKTQGFSIYINDDLNGNAKIGVFKPDGSSLISSGSGSLVDLRFTGDLSSVRLTGATCVDQQGLDMATSIYQATVPAPAPTVNKLSPLRSTTP